VAAPERANLISVTEISFALKCTRHKAQGLGPPPCVASFSRDFSTLFLSRRWDFPPAARVALPLAGLTFIKSSLSAGQKFCTAALVDQSGPPADGDKLGSAGRK